MSNYRPIESHIINGYKYRVSLKNKAIETFENISDMSFTQMLAAFNSCQGLNNKDAVEILFQRIKYKNMIELIFACMIGAQRINPSFNRHIMSLEDVYSIDEEEDSTATFADFFKLFGQCFKTLDDSKIEKMANVGKQNLEK